MIDSLLLTGSGDRVAKKRAVPKADAETKHLKNSYEGTTVRWGGNEEEKTVFQKPHHLSPYVSFPW